MINNYTEFSTVSLLYWIGIILFVLAIIYLFFRAEILNTLYYLTLFIISLWSGGIFHSIFKRQYIGWRWVANLVFYGLFFVALFIIVNKGLSPNYAPEKFMDSQRLINQYGILGLNEHFSFLDLKWFLLHLIGVLLLFQAMIRISLSSTYFAIMGNYIISGEEQEPWLAKRTRKYAYFWNNIIFISVTLFVSYYLIAGNFFMWFEYEFPNAMDTFISKVLRGS